MNIASYFGWIVPPARHRRGQLCCKTATEMISKSYYLSCWKELTSGVYMCCVCCCACWCRDVADYCTMCSLFCTHQLDSLVMSA